MKNQMVTSLQVNRLLGIPRGRLKEWIKLGHIKPSRTAQGRGTWYFFSTDDLYLIQLYKDLLDYGLYRDFAGEIVRILRMAGPTFSEAIAKGLLYLIVTKVAVSDKEPLALHGQLINEIPRTMPPGFIYQWAFNLQNIKDRVDALIG